MPGLGSDDGAMRIEGVYRHRRSWRFKAGLLLIFVASIIAGAALASLFK